MTFFIDGPEKIPQIPANNPDIDLPNIMSGLGAAFGVSALENDANFRAHREVLKSKTEVAQAAAERLGPEGLRPLLDRRNQRAIDAGLFAQVLEPTEDVDGLADALGPNFAEEVLKLARIAAENDPDVWQDMDLSEEGMANAASQRMRAEYQDLNATLQMMPGGEGLTRFFGGMAGITADVKNLPFLAAGGGSGSLVRIMGREAVVNVAAEAAFLPSQFAQADRLEIPEPSVSGQLTMAAGAGALFGGGLEALRRGYVLFSNRQRVKRPHRGISDLEMASLVDRAEDALTGDVASPMDEVRKIAEEAPKAPPASREPLILKEEDRIDVAPLPPAGDDLIASAQAAIEEAEGRDTLAKKPLAQALRDMHKSGGQNHQIHPEGEFANELRHVGITPKTMPGLFSRSGRKDFDNLSALEWENDLPGIMEATNTQAGDLYLNRQGLLDVLVRDLDGDSTWLRSRQEARDMQQQLDDHLSGRTAHDDFVEGRNFGDPDGLFINLDEYEFDTDQLTSQQNIQADVEAWMDRKGIAGLLTDEEKAEIITELQRSGGDAEFLVERFLEREADYVDLPEEEAIRYEKDIPFDEPFTSEESSMGSVRSGRERPNEDSQAARDSDADARAHSSTLSEPTDAGEQTLIDGVEPVSQRDRLEAALEAPLRGGDVAADDGLFDLNARNQRELFDDPASPEAQVIHDAVIDDLKTDIENGADVEVDMGDGVGQRAISDVLQELEDDQEFLEVMNLCGRPKA